MKRRERVSWKKAEAFEDALWANHLAKGHKLARNKAVHLLDRSSCEESIGRTNEARLEK